MHAVARAHQALGGEIDLAELADQPGAEALASWRAWATHDLTPEIAGLTGFELAALYRRTRALVFPSLAEGFGLPVAEAMAAAVILDHLLLDRGQTGGIRGPIG